MIRQKCCARYVGVVATSTAGGDRLSGPGNRVQYERGARTFEQGMLHGKVTDLLVHQAIMEFTRGLQSVPHHGAGCASAIRKDKREQSSRSSEGLAGSRHEGWLQNWAHSKGEEGFGPQPAPVRLGAVWQVSETVD